jgi:flagellar basal-body rod modification protein FlgD
MATVQATGTSSDIFSAINSKAKSASTQTEASATEAAQDRFLKLLVTQLKNQDPLNPMDNAQMTSQLAQINTVTGIEKLNSTLTSLSDTFNSGQAMQAAGMVGKNVLVVGSQIALADGQAYGGVNLSSAADNVKLQILDVSGAVVQTQNLGARNAGNFSFAWDGMTDAGTEAPSGAYKFTVEATRGSEKLAADPLQVGTVSAVVRSKAGFLLDLGALGTVDFKNVQQIL